MVKGSHTDSEQNEKAEKVKTQTYTSTGIYFCTPERNSRAKTTRTEKQHGNVDTTSNGKAEALVQLAMPESWFCMNTLINHFYLQIKVTSM